MIVEERIYTLKPNSAPQFLSLYEEEGLAIQVPILGRLVGYFSTEIGNLNQVIHMWAYKDLAERAERRENLWASKPWNKYAAKNGVHLLNQENRILIPAPFSPWANDDPALDMAK